MELEPRSADNLIWIDLEFTNLDESVAGIMQAAMIVTRTDLTPIPPPGIPDEIGGLLFDVKITPEQAESASVWVRANLPKQIERSLSPEAMPPEKVEELFVAYLLTACEIPDGKSYRPLLCGNSVHGDKRFIARHMPKLDNLLSFRLLDVTTIKELARRWCPELQFQKNRVTIQQWYPHDAKIEGEAHDALFDIKGSIAELNFYRQHLFAQRARGKKKAKAE